MKASGVAWLGEVPGHWSVSPLRRSIDEITSGSRGWAEFYSDEGAPFIRIGNLTRDGIDLNLNEVVRVSPPTNAEGVRTSANTGDIVLSITADLGSIGVVPAGLGEAYVSQHVALIRPAGKIANRRWLAYALRAMPSQEQLRAAGYGGTKVQLGLNDVTSTEIAVPPSEEQQAIATFLDRETARIDALVAAKRRLIALLQEKRAALIARAVTRGLDPEAPIKDSGVAWLGQVPAHWAVKRFRFVASVCEGQVDPEADEISQMMLVAPNHVESGTGTLILEETAEDQGAISGKYPVREGEVVYSKIRPALNKVWVADRDCMCSADMYPILCGAEILPAYLAAYMRSPGFLKLMVDESLRVAMPKVNRETLADAPIAVPPIDEQAAIVSEINRATAKIDAALNLASETVARLTEYRSTLITSAVTGRIDVRAAA